MPGPNDDNALELLKVIGAVCDLQSEFVALHTVLDGLIGVDGTQRSLQHGQNLGSHSRFVIQDTQVEFHHEFTPDERGKQNRSVSPL